MGGSLEWWRERWEVEKAIVDRESSDTKLVGNRAEGGPEVGI